MGSDNKTLSGLSVLVTRPEHQAGPLVQKIRNAGGQPLCFPLLSITSTTDQKVLMAAIDDLDTYQWVIFISINAVEFAVQAIRHRRHWPSQLKVAVIGKSSSDACERLGIPVDACPVKQLSSEGLLALPEMQEVKNQRFMIFRGNGGRELLAQTLRERGATVDNIEAYRREKPTRVPPEVIAAGQSGAIDAILINSVESLQNLVALLESEPADWLYNTPLLAVSPRIVSYARDCGFVASIQLADNATDAAVMDALLADNTLNDNETGKTL